MIRVQSYLNKDSLLLSIYHSLVISRIRYCIINWNHGNSAVALLNHLQNICNKFIRLTLRLNNNEDVLPLMKQHNLLTVSDTFKYEIDVFRFHATATDETTQLATDETTQLTNN